MITHNDFLKYKNCVITNKPPESFEFLKKLTKFHQQSFIYKEKCGTFTKVKQFTTIYEIFNTHQLYCGTLVLASYCYSGDNV